VSIKVIPADYCLLVKPALHLGSGIHGEMAGVVHPARLKPCHSTPAPHFR